MINDKGLRNYRNLLYYFEKRIAVHFSLENGEWHNGTVLDVSKEKLTLVLMEFKKGELPFLLEDIKEDSIKPCIYISKEIRE